MSISYENSPIAQDILAQEDASLENSDLDNTVVLFLNGKLSQEKVNALVWHIARHNKQHYATFLLNALPDRFTSEQQSLLRRAVDQKSS